jgi:hypothetical protein
MVQAPDVLVELNWQPASVAWQASSQRLSLISVR